MRSRTIANERIRSFYDKLKRPYLFSWYLVRLGSKNNDWHRLTNRQKQSEFKIDQIAFFKKHFWYHFTKFSINGWIPVKHFRKNYCRLKLPINICSREVNSELACILMLCRYIRPDVNVKSICTQYKMKRPKSIQDLFMIIANKLGRFQNISHKSMRRIRNQIRHQRPVVMKIWALNQPLSIIIEGFNRRLFQYISPLDGESYLITRGSLLKAWQKCCYQAFSY